MKILYFSTVNWKWIKQRPHFIAFNLSLQGHDVEYLSLNPFGKTAVKKINIGRLKVIDSYVLPMALKFRWVERLNVAYIQARLAARKYDMIILTSPLQYQYIPKSMRSSCTIIYECMDNMPYFYDGHLRERMLSEEMSILQLADAVITSSDQLREKMQHRSLGKQLSIQTIYNAVDKESFTRIPKKIILKEPNLLYIGTVGQWLDWSTIELFAKKHTQYTIYLIGPYELNRELPSNVICLGSVPHEEVVDYIHSGNVMLLPFKVNELTKAVDPVKLYEYLSMSKPVISTYWRELDRFKCEQLKFYSEYDEFERQVLQHSTRKNESELNFSFLNVNHWEERVYEYIRFITAIQERKQIKFSEKKGYQ